MRPISKRNWFLSGRDTKFGLFTIVSFGRDKRNLLIRYLVMNHSCGIKLFTFVLRLKPKFINMDLLSSNISFVVSVLITFRFLIVIMFCDVDFGVHVMTFCLEFGSIGLTEGWMLLL